MSNPTPAAVAAIKSKVAALGGFAALTDAQVVAALNAADVANPAPQGTVPKPFQATDVGAIVSSATLAGILAIPAFEMTIRPMLDNPNPKDSDTILRLNQWAAELFKAGKLTQSEFDALAAPTPGTTTGAAEGLFNQAVADPSYQPQLSWATVNLGRPVDTADSAYARAH